MHRATLRRATLRLAAVRPVTMRLAAPIVAVLCAASLLTSAGPALARTPGETVDAFYEALRAADAEALRALLAEDATVRLADLGFDMTAEEFVASMDVWADVAADMTMRVRPDPDAPDRAGTAEGTAEGTVVRLVCYEFPSNTSFTRGTSRVEGGRIAFNEQVEIGETCEGF